MAEMNLSEIIKKLSENQKNGKTLNETSVNDFINNNLKQDDAEKLKAVLNDEEKMEKILNSSLAKELFNKFYGGKGNG